ncbi:PAF acetylhydrolase family protein [Phaeosphaeriaceae sp. PMI808]|nr:PAF acetylhydrolase family protein [Phaeosphaeriaceae sp. PMI808]
MWFLLSIPVLLLANATAGYLIPNPPGKHNVILTTGSLVDYNRNGRELMVSVFQPAACKSTVQVDYMPNKTADYQGPYLEKQFNISVDFSPLFLEARLPVCEYLPGHCSAIEDRPILLLSSGWAIPRLYYSVLASAIASEGFMVITMDHPGETNIITYPDGHAVYGTGPGNPTAEEYAQLTEIRVADVSFIINQLNNATAISNLLPYRGSQKFQTDRVAMLGHSLGGAAAVAAAGKDTRVRGAIDWDGSFFGSVPASGLTQPVLYMAEENATDPTWLSLWPQLKGPKLWVEVAKTTHMTFSDALVLLKAAGQDTGAFADLLGAIAPAQLVRILVAYTTTWMDGVFKGKMGGALLQGSEHNEFPEVSNVRKDGF